MSQIILIGFFNFQRPIIGRYVYRRIWKRNTIWIKRFRFFLSLYIFGSSYLTSALRRNTNGKRTYVIKLNFENLPSGTPGAIKALQY